VGSGDKKRVCSVVFMVGLMERFEIARVGRSGKCFIVNTVLVGKEASARSEMKTTMK